MTSSAVPPRFVAVGLAVALPQALLSRADTRHTTGAQRAAAAWLLSEFPTARAECMPRPAESYSCSYAF